MEESRGIAHPDCMYALWKLARLTQAIKICELALERAEKRISRGHPMTKNI
jgi:hypothetical protein